MSTKIYNAYRLKEGYTAEELFEKIKEARKLWLDICYDYVCSNVNHDVNLSELTDSLRQELESGRNSPFNLKASCVVYFHEGRIYIQFFGFDYPVPKELQKAYGLTNLFDPMLEDFHYQNQADTCFDFDYSDGKIAEVDYLKLRANWEERERVWKAITADSAIPSRAGLCYDFYDSYDPLWITHRIAQGRCAKQREEYERQQKQSWWKFWRRLPALRRTNG